MSSLYAVIAQDGGIGAEIFRKMGVDVNQLAFDVKQAVSSLLALPVQV